MLDSNFDPYQALLNLDKNVQTLILAHNALAKRVEEQAHVIDVLVEGLSRSNTANEILMREMAESIKSKLQDIP
jgi:hypothetical protein